MTQELTKEQAVIVSGFTGYAACAFGHLHQDVEKRMGRPVFTHEFWNADFAEQVRGVYREDFLAICNKEPS